MRRLIVAALLLGAAPAAAHNMWIKPSAATVSGEDGWVSFDAAASTDVFIADHQPLRIEQVKAFAPDGSETRIENGITGRYRSTFDLHLTRPGTWRVAIENAGVQGSYKLGGEDYRVGGRPPGGPGGMRPPGAPGAASAGGPAAKPPGQSGRPGANAKFVPGGPDFALPAGATDVKLTQIANRNEVFVTLGEPSEIKPTGKGLEMVPLTHPADLVADEPGRFRFLVEGKPAANLEVRLIPDGKRYRNAQGEIVAKTDAAGEVSVTWPAAGLYWMNATFQDGTSTVANVSGRRFNYVTTLEVMTP
ncbi:DUF4198 domain-containing protein [Sphingosinicella sp. BN140058]|uniref:DUF4198 domain-containing protein n=1 Tax=Sphingosinicella sp. BN140058 TaxID=1892855 RepID=UPI0010110E87|nr:DUF4198 domain-containing protein [Sphingosinicella sp. BN140058]QAY77948.1 DUF4198 domain-containing protein [Sphingosinicella sp. BN140058]